MANITLSSSINGDKPVDQTRVHGCRYFGLHVLGSPGTTVEVWGTVDARLIDWYLISVMTVDPDKTELVDQKEAYMYAIRYQFVDSGGQILATIPLGASFHLHGAN